MEFRTFKNLLKQFIAEKKVVVMDLSSEYSEHVDKLEEEKRNNDLKLHLTKTIKEYEDMV